MDMVVFLRKNHLNTGTHRFLEALSIFDGCEIKLIDKIEESNIDVPVGIFGGFLPQDIIKSTIKNKYYIFCSPFGQADLSDFQFYSLEIQILMQCFDLIKKGLIKNCITSSKSLEFRFGFIYFPPVRFGIKEHVHINKDRKNYGFLGNNIRKHKNTANQLAAISLLNPKEPIVVRHGDAHAYWSYLFECDFIDKSNLTNEEYFKEIASHRLCFQCSFSESFDYQALEYCLMGVPVVHSSVVYWYPIKDHLVSNPDDTEEIYKVAQQIINNPVQYNQDSEYLSKWAIRYNEENKNKLYEAYKNIRIYK